MSKQLYMGRILVLLGWFFSAMPAFVAGQEFRFMTYTVKEGLSNNDIRSLTIDPDGFLWIGSSNGLNRWDGNSFEPFTHDPADSSSIGGNLIQGFFTDHLGRLWIGTNAGISLYLAREHRFINYAPDTSVLSPIGLHFQAFGEDEAGKLWIGTKNDLLVFDPQTRHWMTSGWAAWVSRTAPSGGNRLRVVVLDIQPKDRGQLWVWTTYGLCSVRTDTREFRAYPLPFHGGADYDYYGCHLQYVDAAGNPWVTCSGRGVAVYDTTRGRWGVNACPDSLAQWEICSGVRPYHGDTLVYGSGPRLVFFDGRRRRMLRDERLIAGRTVRDEQPDAGEQAGPGEPFCRDLLWRDGVCWVATTRGLLKMQPRPPGFEFRASPDVKPVDRVFRSASDRMTILASWAGVRLERNGSIAALNTPEGRAIAGEHLYWLELPAFGKACLNGEHGFYVLDRRTGLLRQPHWPALRNPGNELNIRNMVADRDGLVWIRTHDQGIFIYDPRTDSIGMPAGLPDGSTKMLSYLYYDSLTHCLFISEEFNGIYIYDIAKRSLQHHLLNAPPSMRGAGVICITGDGRGRVWMIDLLSGIIAYDPATARFSRYTRHDGLISDNVIWCCYDLRGGLWVSTDQGLSCLDIATRQFTNFYTADGYPSTGEDGAFISRDADSRLYMAYHNGYYTWRPADLVAGKREGRLYLRKFQVSGRDEPGADNYRLAAGENNIQVRLGWLSLNEDAPPAIEYRLNDGPWLGAGVSTVLSFAGLPAGSYSLSARAKRQDAEPLSLTFFIARPFWKDPRIVTPVLLLLVLGLVVANRYRIRRLKKEAGLRQQVMESEMATLRSQMNPHFVFNTLNSINSYIIENRTHQASDYLTDFSRLMRMILDHSRKKKVTLEEELTTVKLYLELESRRLEAGFDYRIDVEPELDTRSLFVPPLIIQPFAENAIWHGLRHRRTEGHIEIRVGVAGERLLVTVTDNGIGRQAAGRLQRNWKQGSFGTAATIRRIRLADPSSEVIIEDLLGAAEESRGTRVNITLHFKTTQYAGQDFKDGDRR